jgi:small conductance mechanosensitive channel
MTNKYVASNWLLLPVILFTMMSNPAFAEDCPADIKAVTNSDVKVPVDVLSHRVKPLTKCELEAEAQAWLLLLQEKVAEISDAEVAAIYKKEEIKKARKLPKKQKRP